MSIAEKLQTIAENEQRVYDAGFTAGSATGGGEYVINALTKDGTDFSYMFYGKKTMTEVPIELDTSKGTNFSNMFAYCEALVSAPHIIDTSKGTNLSYMFQRCLKLKELPQEIDTSNATNLSRMFDTCNKLTQIPQLDTSKNTDFAGMFSSCAAITEYPQLDLSNGINFSNMFAYHKYVEELPALNTSKGTNFNSMFFCNKNSYNVYGGGNQLRKITSIDLTNATNVSSIFTGCNLLEDIAFIGTIPISISFQPSPLLSADSIRNVINALSTTTTGKTLTLNKTAVQNAFGTNYDSSTEWTTLKNSKSNWTITLS